MATPTAGASASRTLIQDDIDSQKLGFQVIAAIAIIFALLAVAPTLYNLARYGQIAKAVKPLCTAAGIGCGFVAAGSTVIAYFVYAEYKKIKEGS